METNTIENFTDKAKVLCNEVMEDGKHTVERTFKRGIVATQDCIEDTTHFIKRHPWQSIGTAVGIGVAVGLCAGWQAGRCCVPNVTR